ncbi:MAG: amidohydrolase [Deltaproteobacteria bacterium]|nr:amidohydrolase [Deltaproteobacteria bacterium]
MSSDLILTNANVITMNPAQPTAGLVVIRGNKILLVGDGDQLGEVRGAKTKVIDCQGKTVVPGFNDAHCHIFAFIRKLGSIDLSPPLMRSIADIKAAVRQRARNIPAGSWITGTDYNEFYLAEKRHPNRRDLDEAAPEHPVVLAHRSLHACVLNSRALSMAGITRETPEPPGAIIDREIDSGEPSGLLFEMVGYIRHRVLPPLSKDELARGMALASKHYLSMGITSLQEASANNDYARWQALQRFKDSGELKSRVSMMSGFDALPQFQERGLAFGSGDEQLRLGGVKILVNETTGDLQPPQEELNRQALSAHRAGFQLAVHCVEPGTVAAAIAALEYVGGKSSVAGRRHRLEHVSECPPELLGQLKKLEAMVVTQPPFIYYSGERYLATIPRERQRWLYIIKSLLDSGLVVAGSSDSPVVPDNPLVGIYAAVSRRAESGQQLLLQEAVSPQQALAMYTTNAAYASFEEDIKGAIAPGKLADMVILSDDPLESPPEQIKDIRVEMTIIDGKVAWED